MSDASQSREPDHDVAARTGVPLPGLPLVDGPEFVLAPHHRLFVVFDEAA